MKWGYLGLIIVIISPSPVGIVPMRSEFFQNSLVTMGKFSWKADEFKYLKASIILVDNVQNTLKKVLNERKICFLKR